MKKQFLLLFFICSATSIIFSSFHDGNSSESSESVEKVEGITPLMKAARDGNFQEVELLVEQGAQLDEKDGDNFTAFTHAFIANKSEVAQFLYNRMNKKTSK